MQPIVRKKDNVEFGFEENYYPCPFVDCIVFSFYLVRAEADHEPRCLSSDDHRELTGSPGTCNATFYVVKAGMPSNSPFSDVDYFGYAKLNDSTNDSSVALRDFDTPISIVILF